MAGRNGGAPMDVAALRVKARELMAAPAYKDFTHADHAKVTSEVNAIYTQIGKLGIAK